MVVYIFNHSTQEFEVSLVYKDSFMTALTHREALCQRKKEEMDGWREGGRKKEKKKEEEEKEIFPTQ